MRQSTWQRNALVVGVASIILAGALLNTRALSAGAHRTGVDRNVTLSVYTCCGSLTGFSDTNPADLSSMHHIYGRLWARRFPHLTWHETPFADQVTLEKQLATVVKAGRPPDMVFIQGGDIGYIVLRGLAQPLDRYFARDHVSDGYFLPGMARWAHFGGHWWAIPAVSGPLGGQHIYLPRYMTPLGYSNRNLVTFDDYYRMSQKAVRFDRSHHLVRIGYWPGADSWETIGTLMCPLGHGLYDTADRPTATDPCNVDYLRYLKKLVDLYDGYTTLQQFLAGDPDTDFLSGDRRAYMVTGKALILPSGLAYWNLTPFDMNNFGFKGGVAYQLTPQPITRHGTLAEVATYPSTMQEIIIPPGARHPDVAFALSKMMCWDNGYLLGRATSGSPVRRAQKQWLGALIAGEAALRKQAGLPGNPAASLQGLTMQPVLGRLSQASNPINPVDPYYQQQLVTETERVLSGQATPAHALQVVQQRVLVQEQRLEARHGSWILFATLSPRIAPGTILYRATTGPGGLETWSGTSEWRHAADGTLYNDGSKRDSLIVAPYDPGKIVNYEVQADMKVVPAQCPFGFGIVVRWENNRGLYSSADCRGGPAELWVGPLQGAKRIAKRTFTMSTDWLTYRLRVHGATIFYSVSDGDRILVSMQATDNGLHRDQGGQIGLWTHNDRFSVRDFKVRALP